MRMPTDPLTVLYLLGNITTPRVPTLSACSISRMVKPPPMSWGGKEPLPRCPMCRGVLSRVGTSTIAGLACTRCSRMQILGAGV